MIRIPLCMLNNGGKAFACSPGLMGGTGAMLAASQRKCVRHGFKGYLVSKHRDCPPRSEGREDGT